MPVWGSNLCVFSVILVVAYEVGLPLFNHTNGETESEKGEASYPSVRETQSCGLNGPKPSVHPSYVNKS